MIAKNSRKIVQQLLRLLYVKTMDICPAYVLKPNSNREKQVILLMIPNGEG